MATQFNYRMMSNRVSDSRSKRKQLQHISEMEKKIEVLQATIANLSPQIEFYENYKKMKQMKNLLLEMKIETLRLKLDLSNAEIEEKRAEIKRLELKTSPQGERHKEVVLSMPYGWDDDLEQIMALCLDHSLPPSLADLYHNQGGTSQSQS
ncbi:hypothetical protein LguiA_020833 [Lonicera macranthoides]